MWKDIAAIVFICVTANHLGLIVAIEQAIRHKLPVINCPKCFTCWGVMTYQLVTNCNPLLSLAISLLAAYTAIWLELFEGIIDKLCDYVYNKIYPTTDTDNADT